MFKLNHISNHVITILFPEILLHLYKSKSWSIVFNIATLKLSHINSHVITILFPEFLLQFKNSFPKF